MNEKEMYLIQDTRQFCGNCIFWWAPDRAGYVCNVDEAGRYTEEEARRIEGIRGTDVAWPENLVLKYTVRHVRGDQQPFSQATTKKGRRRKETQREIPI